MEEHPVTEQERQSLMDELLETVAYAGDVQPWREVPETDTSEDEPDDEKLRGAAFNSDQLRDEQGQWTGGAYDTVIDSALTELGERQKDAAEHHIGIDLDTGERVFDMVGDAGGPEGALAKGLTNPTLDDLRPSAGSPNYSKVVDKRMLDIHTHPGAGGGGTFSEGDFGQLMFSHIDTMIVVDGDSVGTLKKTPEFLDYQKKAWAAEGGKPWTPRTVKERYNAILDDLTTPEKVWTVEQALRDTNRQLARELGVKYTTKLRNIRSASDIRTAKASKSVGAFDFRFDAKNQAVIDWADRHSAELIDGITETSREAINNAIAELQETGNWDEAYDEILAAVGDETRADLIARTETMLAANNGQREAWDQATEKGLLSGNEKATWIATPVDTVCDDCEALNETVRDLDGEYPAPGGEGPPLHPRCRCTEGLVIT